MGPRDTVIRIFRLHAIRLRLQFPADVAALLGVNTSVRVPYLATTRRVQTVVRNRTVIIRKAELTGDAGG